MFQHNDIVEDNYGNIGRVLYHDKSKREVYILVRISERTWKQIKVFDLLCRRIKAGFMWYVEDAFGVRRIRQTYIEPDIQSLKNNWPYQMPIMTNQ
jgi:hypothetical protein